MFVSFLVGCVCAITASSQTSDDLALGLSEFSKGDFTSAAALFARAEEAAPGTTDALLYESKAYIHLEQFTAAEDALRLFGADDLAQMLRLRAAFNPEGRCSPHKLFPTAGGCVERVRPGRHAAL